MLQFTVRAGFSNFVSLQDNLPDPSAAHHPLADAGGS